MEYQRKFIVISHCILSQLAVVKGLKRAEGSFPLAKILIEEGVGMIQMPCPELNELGTDRPPMSYEEYYNIEGYIDRCQEWLEPVISQIKQFINHGDQFLGIIGINESPNCSITGQRGVWMELLFERLEQENIPAPFIEVPTWYEEHSTGDFHSQLSYFLKGE